MPLSRFVGKRASASTANTRAANRKNPGRVRAGANGCVSQLGQRRKSTVDARYLPDSPAQGNTAVIVAELIGDDTCTALGITARTPTGLCRKLLDAGHDPATPLEAWRGDVLCLRLRS